MRFQDVPEDQRAFTFPTRFLIKALGKAEHDVSHVVVGVLDSLEVSYVSDDISVKKSKHGKYDSVTVWVHAQSRAELDSIYAGLKARPEIVMTM